MSLRKTPTVVVRDTDTDTDTDTDDDASVISTAEAAVLLLLSRTDNHVPVCVNDTPPTPPPLTATAIEDEFKWQPPPLTPIDDDEFHWQPPPLTSLPNNKRVYATEPMTPSPKRRKSIRTANGRQYLPVVQRTAVAMCNALHSRAPHLTINAIARYVAPALAHRLGVADDDDGAPSMSSVSAWYEKEATQQQWLRAKGRQLPRPSISPTAAAKNSQRQRKTRRCQ